MAVQDHTPSIANPPMHKLTTEEDAKYAALLGRITSEWGESFHGSVLSENERLFLSRECLLRYLRASGWNLTESFRRLDATLRWRRERRIDELHATEFSEELKTERLIPLGNDKHGRPCLYYDLVQDNSDLREIDLSYLSFITERTIEMMGPGVESITVMVDLKNVSRADMLSIAKTRAYISAFQDHNPERLGLALASSMPWWFHGIWRIIRPFLDPVVREKVRFNEGNSSFVPREHLWARYGGDLEFQFDHKVFWEEYLGEAKKRRDQYVERWHADGKQLGASELSLKSVTSDLSEANEE